MERRPKNRGLPKFRGRKHQTHPSAPFLPYLFRQDGKDRAAGGVGSCKFATTSQSRLRRASSPGRGAFSAAAGNQPLRRFAPAPLGGEPFSAAFSSASCRKPARRAAGRKNRPPGPHICPLCAHVLPSAEQKPRNCAHCRRLRPRRRVFCVIFNVLSIKSLNFAGNNAKNFIF